MPYRNSFTTINNNYFKKIRHHLFKNQLLELNLLSEIDNIIHEEEEIFKKHPTVGLPEVSKLIDSAITKGQGERGKQFSRKKKNTA